VRQVYNKTGGRAVLFKKIIYFKELLDFLAEIERRKLGVISIKVLLIRL